MDPKTLEEMTKRKRFLVEGTVQGIGFRPFVYRLALRYGLAGFVANDSMGAEIEIQGDDHALSCFEEAFYDELPPLAHINSVQKTTLSPRIPKEPFEIRTSRVGNDTLAFVTPDANVCSDCLREMYDPKDRRYLYPFINCTNCGPRFSIIKEVPYDRPLTTMASFPMCADCESEYKDPMDRRFHAQPVACPNCGPKVWITDEKGIKLDVGDPLQVAGLWLRQEKIVCIKGLGGFHLAVDAGKDTAVQRLRERKWREDKPLALMVKDIETAKKIVDLNHEEEELLKSTPRPIVLAGKNKAAGIAASVAPGVAEFGVMLPYTPLHYLLFDYSPSVLVMTSGNPSSEPLAYENEAAISRLRSIADGFLLHDRDIYNTCDDSVVRWSHDGEKLLRRARGYAPLPLTPKRFPVKESLIALGPELKNTVTVTRKGQLVCSQHLGDLTNVRAVQAFKSSIERMIDLLGVEPCVVVCDEHPQYFSTRYARDKFGHLPLSKVQHHHAHMAAVMIEHDLEPEREVVAALWDGTGFGRDETTWGGEFFVGGYLDFRRVAHTRPVPLPGGDSATKHPWRIATSVFHELGIDPRAKGADWIDRQPIRDKDLLWSMLERGLRCPISGGAGRLFDAAAAILDFDPQVTDEITYEAQAAIELEALCKHVPQTKKEELLPFYFSCEELDLLPALFALFEQKARGVSVDILAAKFIDTAGWACGEVLAEIVERESCGTIILSGGCFQNVRLADMVDRICKSRGFEVYLPRDYPPNDGGVSLGQAAVALARRL